MDCSQQVDTHKTAQHAIIPITPCGQCTWQVDTHTKQHTCCHVKALSSILCKVSTLKPLWKFFALSWNHCLNISIVLVTNTFWTFRTQLPVDTIYLKQFNNCHDFPPGTLRVVCGDPAVEPSLPHKRSSSMTDNIRYSHASLFYSKISMQPVSKLLPQLVFGFRIWVF